MSRNNDYTTGILLNYLYHQKYKLIGIDSSKKTKTCIPQQINFTRKPERDDGTARLFIAKKQQKPVLNFPLDSFIVTE